jgi:hypothetical protein
MLSSPIVELRQYTLRPGQRDVLIDLFEAELVEPQEAAGMTVIGTFRDACDGDRFVWLRGFESMESRARGLSEFYGGSVWQRHRDAANATMVDSDDVLLLRPAAGDGGFEVPAEPPAMLAEPDRDRGVVEALVLRLRAPLGQEAAARLSVRIAARVAADGGAPLAFFVSEESENTYPALPVREGEHVFVAFSGYPGRGRRSVAGREWDEVVDGVAADALAGPSILRLVPTRRSRLDASSS